MDVKNPVDKGMIIGGLLVGFGALLLLQTFGIIPNVAQLTVSLAFLAGAGVFLYVFLNNSRNWWALFPMAGLGFVGLVIAGDLFLPGIDFEGPLFLGGIGLAFLVVYVTNQQHLWAVIPGGALVTLATVAAVDNILYLRWMNGGTIFFWGMAVTFGSLYFLAPNGSRNRWAWSLIVAAVLGAIGFLTVAGSILKHAFPVLLILGGAYLLVKDRNITKGQ